MLLDGAPAFKILGVYRVKRVSSRGSTAPRPWASLAIRLSGSSRFESEGEQLSAPEGSVIYIPEGVSFSILLMNILSPYIEIWTRRVALGAGGKVK